MIPTSHNGVRRIAIALAAGCTFAGTAGGAHMAHAGDVAWLFHGNPTQQAGIKIGRWGSGSIEEDTRVIYSGTESLKIITHGMYQGAILTFDKPVDLTPYSEDKTAYLQIAVIVPGMSGTTSDPGGGAGFSAPPPPGFAPTEAGGPGIRRRKPIENLRIVLVTASGKALEFLMPMVTATDDRQWKLLNIPVPTIPGLTAQDAQIKEMRLFGDAASVLYVGKIAIVQDATSLRVEPYDEQVIRRNDRHPFVANASGGITPLKYAWDWDASDGIQEEATGRIAYHTYYKSGDYIATLTVSDYYGLKAPVKTSIKVHVTP